MILSGLQWDLPEQKISRWHASRFLRTNMTSVVLCGRYSPITYWSEPWEQVKKDYEASELCKQCRNCVRRLRNVGKNRSNE